MTSKQIKIVILAALAVFVLSTTPAYAAVVLRSRVAESWLERITRDVNTYGPSEDVIEELGDFLQVYPNTDSTDEALLLLGTIYADMDEHKMAIAKYKKMLSEFPKSDHRVTALYKLAYSRYYAEGESDEAKALLNQALKELKKAEETGTSTDEQVSKLGEEALALLSDIDKVDAGAAIAPGHAIIGVVLPLKGRYAAYGERALKGIRLASEVFSRKYGHIEIAVRDSGDGSVSIRKTLKKLVANPNTAALIGPLVSDTAVEMGRYAQRRQIPVIVLSQKGGIPRIGNFVFRSFLTPRQQAAAIADHAVNDMGLESFAILYPDNAYGKTLASHFTEEVESQAGVVVNSLAYGTGEVDFTDELSELFEIEVSESVEGRRHVTEFQRELYPDALFVPDSHQRVGLIAPYLAYYNIDDVTLLGTNGWNSPELTRMAGRHVEGAIFVDGFFEGSNRADTKQFVKKFKKVYGGTPGVLESHAYDAAMLLMHALRKKGPLSREIIRQRLANTKGFKSGSSGSISFDRQGESEKKLFLLTVQDGEIKEVE